MTDPKVARCYQPGWTYAPKDSNHHIKDLFDKVRAEIAAKQAQTTTVRVMRKKP